MSFWKSTVQYFKKQRDQLQALSEKEIIAISLKNAGKLTAASLAAQSELSITKASWKLYNLSAKGVFLMEYDYRDHSQVFALKKPELYQHMQASSPEAQNLSEGISDAEVINIAIRTKGKLTSGVLCVSANIPVDEAKKRLRELQHTGVFDVDATESGSLVYTLNDMTILEELVEAQPEIVMESAQ